MAQHTLWLRRPLLLGDEEDRRTTWLELFIDLMFVAIISALAQTFSGDITLTGAARFTLVFLPAWWIWAGLTVYNDRFEADDVSHRLAFFVIMVALGGLAVAARYFFTSGFAIYGASYVLARVTIIVLWIRGGFHNPRVRPLTTRYAIGFGLAAVLWLVAMAVAWPLRLWIVLLALLLDFGTPLATLAAQAELPRLSASHLPERFGLFVIIVLGESVIGVETAVGADFARGTFAHVALGPTVLALAFVIWWLYFDHVAENPPLAGPRSSLAWFYPHLALLIALGMLGAAARALVGPGMAAQDPAALMLMCASAGASFAMIGVLEFATEPGAERHHPIRSLGVHGGSGVVAIALGFVGERLGALSVLLLLVALGIAQIAYGFVTRARHLRWDDR